MYTQNTTTIQLAMNGYSELTNHPTSTIKSAANINALIGGQGNYLNTGAGYNQRYAAASICQVAFFTNALTSGQVQGLVYAAGIPPAFLQQPPVAVTNFSGTTNTITIRASGAINLVYQWYYTNSSGAVALTDGLGISGLSTVSGSASSKLTIANLQVADSGYYFVVVTNNFGSIASSMENLTVNARPTIIAQFPVTYTNLFTLYAAGSAPAPERQISQKETIKPN